MLIPARSTAAALLLVVCGLIGCTPIQQSGGAGGMLGRSEPPAEQPYPGPTAAMSIRWENGHTEQVAIPLSPGMTLQAALEHQELPDQFAHMKIHVLRVTPQSKGRPVPLKAEYDPAQGRVGILYDMALYPGDHIIVAEQTYTRFDEAVERFTGVWGAGR